MNILFISLIDFETIKTSGIYTDLLRNLKRMEISICHFPN